MRGARWARAALVLCAAALLAVCCAPASATHFRAGNIQWRRVSPSNPRQIYVELRAVWETNRSPNSASVSMGNGQSVNAVNRVESRDAALDTETALANFTYTYPATGTYTISFTGCCRMQIGNGGTAASWILSSVVNAASTGPAGSPVSYVPTWVRLPRISAGTLPVQYQLLFGDPQAGGNVTCAFAAQTTSGVAIPSAGGIQAQVSPSCMLTWNTQGTVAGTRFAAQVVGTSTATSATVVADFVIEIMSGTQAVPTCTLLWTDSLAPAPSELVVYPGGELRVTFVGNDTDSSTLVLLATGLVAGSAFAPAPGTSLPRDAANATLVYAPTSASRGVTAAGSVSFRDELGLVGACSFTVAVRNRVPVFVTPQAWFLTEDDAEQVRGLGVVELDADEASIALAAGPYHGSATVNGTLPGTLRYSPRADFAGVDNVTLTVSDGYDTAALVIVFNVAAVNDAPTLLAPSVNVSTDRDTPIVVTLTPADVDDASLQVSFAVLPAHGNASSSSGVCALTSACNVTYSPARLFYGNDSFVVRFQDGGGATVDARVNVHVRFVNTAPRAANVSVELVELVSVALHLLGNDTIGDDDTPATALVVMVSEAPRFGSATVSSPGAQVLRYESTAVLFRTPSFAGRDELRYEVCDEHGACTSAYLLAALVHVNEAPVLSVASTNLHTLEAHNVSTAFSVADLEDDALGLPSPAVDVACSAAHGAVLLDALAGRVVYAPSADFWGGNDSFVLRAVDSGNATSNVTVQVFVEHINRPPSVSATLVNLSTREDEVVRFVVNATDVDSAELAFAIVRAPVLGVASLATVDAMAALVTFEPLANAFGADVMVVSVSDGLLSVNVTLAIDIASVNDVPHVVVLGSSTARRALHAVVARDRALVFAPRTVDVEDGERCVAALEVLVQPEHAVAEALLTGAGGRQCTPVLRVWPHTGFVGNDSLAFRVRDFDGGLSDQVWLDVAVREATGAERRATPASPLRTYALVNVSLLQNGNLSVSAAELAGWLGAVVPEDVAQYARALSVVRPPLRGSALISADSLVVTYAPAPFFYGRDSFTVAVRDGQQPAWRDDDDLLPRVHVQATVLPLSTAPTASVVPARAVLADGGSFVFLRERTPFSVVISVDGSQDDPVLGPWGAESSVPLTCEHFVIVTVNVSVAPHELSVGHGCAEAGAVCSGLLSLRRDSAHELLLTSTVAVAREILASLTLVASDARAARVLVSAKGCRNPAETRATLAIVQDGEILSLSRSEFSTQGGTSDVCGTLVRVPGDATRVFVSPVGASVRLRELAVVPSNESACVRALLAAGELPTGVFDVHVLSNVTGWHAAGAAVRVFAAGAIAEVVPAAVAFRTGGAALVTVVGSGLCSGASVADVAMVTFGDSGSLAALAVVRASETEVVVRVPDFAEGAGVLSVSVTSRTRGVARSSGGVLRILRSGEVPCADYIVCLACALQGTCGPCGVDLPVRCASGHCALSSRSCPRLVPCRAGFVRCPDLLCKPSLRDCGSGGSAGGGDGDGGGGALCASGEQRCSDGTCRSPCAAVDACLATMKRCPGGECVPLASTCSAVEACPTGSTRCQDGVCAASCPEFNGCPFATPFTCSDGTCAADEATCDLGCPAGTRRCATRECKPVCTQPFSLRKPAPVAVTLGRGRATRTLITDRESGAVLGMIVCVVDASAAAPTVADAGGGASAVAQLIVRDVPDSRLRAIPGHRSSVVSVLSAALNVSLPGVALPMRLPMTVSLAYNSPASDATPVCLGGVADGEWFCADGNMTVDENGVGEGRVFDAGVFAVITRPVIPPPVVFPPEWGALVVFVALGTTLGIAGATKCLGAIGTRCARAWRTRKRRGTSRVEMTTFDKTAEFLPLQTRRKARLELSLGSGGSDGSTPPSPASEASTPLMPQPSRPGDARRTAPLPGAGDGAPRTGRQLLPSESRVGLLQTGTADSTSASPALPRVPTSVTAGFSVAWEARSPAPVPRHAARRAR